MITNRQHHDIHHVTFCCIGTAYLNLLFDFIIAAIIIFIFGVINEIIDEITYRKQYENPLFDYYIGFDWKDILRNSIGIVLSYPLT